MPGLAPHTRRTRSERSASERRARRTFIAAASAIVLAIAAASAAWAVFSAKGPSDGTALATTRPASRAQTAAEAPGSPTAAAVVPAPEPATLRIAAVGDMIFDRRVRTLISQEGSAAPLARVAGKLRAADLTIGNLESPLSDGGTHNTKKDATFRGDPRAVEALTAAGFDFVSLANNHILDYGPYALADTVAFLDAAGIGNAGAGRNEAAAWRPSTARAGDTSASFLAFSFVVPAGFLAQDDRAGLASGRWDVARIEKAIRREKRAHDYVIVSFHWGAEYKDRANAEQIRVARRCIDAGADVVIAHHPHVIQGVEVYKKGLIAYSLGDFVFDHFSRKTGESFILGADLTPKGVANVTVTPTYLDGYGRPAVVKGAHAAEILSRLKKLSAPFGTKVVIRGDQASVTR